MCQVMSACDYMSDLLRLCRSHVYKSSVIDENGLSIWKEYC